MHLRACVPTNRRYIAGTCRTGASVLACKRRATSASHAQVAYNIRFPVRYYDAETGLFQNVNRDYDPLTRKYIESDPMGLTGGSYSSYGLRE
jgi:RHS repeat-associated protein